MSIKQWLKSKLDDPIVANYSGVPENVLKLNGKREQGPNCWNATIIFFHPHEQIRYIPMEDMSQWLNSYTTEDYYKLCAVGSILALYDEKELIHTAVYVSPGVLWHKRGCGGHWEFVTERQLRRIYSEAIRFEHRIMKEFV